MSGRRLMASVGRPLFNLALREGLVTQEEAAVWSVLAKPVSRWNGSIRPAPRYIDKFERPFTLYLAHRRNRLRIAPAHPSEEKAHNLDLRVGIWVMDEERGPETYNLLQCFTSGKLPLPPFYRAHNGC